MQLIEIVPAGVAVVEADVEDVRLGAGCGKDYGAYFFEIGEGAGGRDSGLGVCGEGGVDGVDVEVLVAAGVLRVEEVFGVAAPEVATDGADGFGADGTGSAEGLAGLLDPDVARALVGLEEGDVLTVGRDLRAGDLDLSEEEGAVDDRRLLGGKGRG